MPRGQPSIRNGSHGTGVRRAVKGDLSRYREKRDFSKTPEPGGELAAAPSQGLRFVVQKHAARRLHYDFRLELDGVLKSWAVAKGPSLDPSEKRLAIHVEDHPIDYGDFEGIIPKGEYGGGTVMIWDRGFWRPEGDPAKGYAKGHLAFELDGGKLHGRWHLIRTKGRPGEKKEQWLLFKSDDEYAEPAARGNVLEEAPELGRVAALDGGNRRGKGRCLVLARRLDPGGAFAGGRPPSSCPSPRGEKGRSNSRRE